MTEYRFDDFCLRKDNLLLKHGSIVRMPPKELRLLRVLLENAGEVVSKDDIVEYVWCGGMVSDESITRCLYMLRKGLGESTNKKYIGTLYGKGYSFIYPVTQQQPEVKFKQPAVPLYEEGNRAVHVALFPFMLKDRTLALTLHDYLFNHLCDLTDDGISMMPSIFTRQCEDYRSILTLLDRMRCDYYISGSEITVNDETLLRLELVRADGQYVIQREGVVLDADLVTNSYPLYQTTIRLLSGIQPSLIRETVIDDTSAARSTFAFLQKPL